MGSFNLKNGNRTRITSDLGGFTRIAPELDFRLIRFYPRLFRVNPRSIESIGYA